MKTLVVIASGAADRPIEELGGRTPLEAAATPAMDRLAVDGRLGRLTPAPNGMRPEECAFVLGLFGLDPASYGEIGGVLDAKALGAEVGSLDQAFRLSLVTADGDAMIDPAAGHVRREEAALLLEALEEALVDTSFVFHVGAATHVLVWKGARDVRVRTVPPHEVVGRSLQAALPRGTGIGRLLVAIERSADVLGGHEVNELRRELGESPASLIWPWTPGVSVPLPDFTARTGRTAAAVGMEPGFVGAAMLQGLHVASEGLRGEGDRPNLRAHAEAAEAALADHDLVFVHSAELARASHARDFVAKVETLERLDGYVVGPLLRAIDAGRDLRLVVIGGEAISATSGRVLTDPVPFAIYGSGVRSQRRGAFTEVGARESGFQVDRAHELLDFLLHLPA